MRRIISRPHRLIAKSLSRFSRNTVDSLTTIRKLKENGVEVWFEKENIWTFQARGEILLTILSSLSQEEARSISENVTWGLRKKFADGKFSVGYSRFLGYDKGEDGNLAINEEQAKTVRLIFGLFIEGLTPCAIAKELTRRGILTVTGKSKWKRPSRRNRRASTPWRLPGITCHITIGTGKAMRKEAAAERRNLSAAALFLKWYKNLYNRSAAFARINA